MDEKISVIIPVYNVEKYLNNCIESVVKQSYQKLEIILVDDGSPDNCPQICDDWAEKDKRIIVIHQKNAGAGAARNAALQVMTGEFVAFVDSDDYLSKDMYETLMKLFDDETDIVEGDFVQTYDNNAIFGNDNVPTIMSFSKEDAMREHISDHYFRQVIWNKIYRRKCVENILFPVGKKIDDEYWTYQVLGKANKLKHCDLKLYAYRQQDNSVMHKLSPMNRVQCIEAKNYRHEYLKKYLPELVSDSYLNLLMTCVYQGQQVIRHGNDKEIKSILVFCEKIIATHKKEKIITKNISLKQRIWCCMAERSLKKTCMLRNMLGIGV